MVGAVDEFCAGKAVCFGEVEQEVIAFTCVALSGLDDFFDEVIV